MHCKARHDKVQYYGRQKSMYHKKKKPAEYITKFNQFDTKVVCVEDEY